MGENVLAEEEDEHLTEALIALDDMNRGKQAYVDYEYDFVERFAPSTSSFTRVE